MIPRIVRFRSGLLATLSVFRATPASVGARTCFHFATGLLGVAEGVRVL